MDTTQISRRQILVVGSCNTDMVIKAAHLPRPGETILGGTFFMNPGGKGEPSSGDSAFGWFRHFYMQDRK